MFLDRMLAALAWLFLPRTLLTVVSRLSCMPLHLVDIIFLLITFKKDTVFQIPLI
jgi:hypothetical protein